MSMNTETNPTSLAFRLLVFQDDGIWIAQCLEYDISAQSRSFRELKYEFEKLFVSHVLASLENNLVPFANTPPAPPEFERMWENAPASLEPRAEWPTFRLPPGIPARYNIPERPNEIRLVA